MTIGALLIPNGEITDGTITISIATLNELIQKIQQLEERIIELEK